MHQRKGKKIIIYLFLLILFGSINNVGLKNIKFDEVKLNISGLKDLDNEIFLKKTNNLTIENLFFLNGKEIIKIFDSNSLIESYKIFKKYPSTLNIEIEQTKFLAKINIDGKEFIVGSNGRLSKTNYSNENLPYIFGKPEIEEFLNFKELIDKSKISYEKIKSFYYFQSKRWDIELENNIIIKLPKDVTNKILDNVTIFLNENNLKKNLKILDARIKNQIILND